MQKYFYWLPPYLGVYIGLFLLKSAWAALLGFHIGILFVLLVSKPKISASILLKSKNKHWLFISILLCGFSGIVIYLFPSLFGITENLSIQLNELGLNQFTWIPFIAYFSLVNPFVEEYFWRGQFGSASKHFHFGDVAYAGYHGIVLIDKVHPLAVLFALTCLTFIGWFWRQVKKQDEGLLAPVLGHMAADFSILTAVYLITS